MRESADVVLAMTLRIFGGLFVFVVVAVLSFYAWAWHSEIAAIRQPRASSFDPAIVAKGAGVMTGIGFLGAGVILRDQRDKTVHGLATAASVWITAALGIACGSALWSIVISGTILAIVILALLRWIDRRRGLSD